MEDFRISNFLAQQVKSFGHDRAEEGAAVSADGGQDGGLGDGSYHFEEGQEQAKRAQEAQAADEASSDIFDDAAIEDATNPDDDGDDPTTIFIRSQLERMHALHQDSADAPTSETPVDADMVLRQQRGRQYYSKQTDSSHRYVNPATVHTIRANTGTSRAEAEESGSHTSLAAIPAVATHGAGTMSTTPTAAPSPAPATTPVPAPIATAAPVPLPELPFPALPLIDAQEAPSALEPKHGSA